MCDTSELRAWARVSTGQTPELLTCIFIHGAGGNNTTPYTNTDEGYWGKLHERTPQCSERRFMHEDTLHIGWEDESLQRRLCSLLGASSPKFEVSDVLIFAHSMGSLILAAALQNSHCKLHPSAAWFAVAAPWHGSVAADKLPEICAGQPSFLDPALHAYARRQLFCEGKGGGPSIGYYSVRTNNNPALARITHWRSRVNGSMCGSSPFGLWSLDSWGLEAFANFAGFGEANDGAVPLSACHPPDVDVAATPFSASYTPSVNHFDLTCRHGDGSWGGDDRKPCSWYSLRR